MSGLKSGEYIFSDRSCHRFVTGPADVLGIGHLDTKTWHEARLYFPDELS